MSVLPPPEDGFEFDTGALIVGGGAGGMVAALSAHERGEEVIVLEADPVPAGSTSLSAGLIPAPGTTAQKAAGIEDTPQLFAADIMKKAKGENDPAIVDALASGAAEVIDWLSDTYGLPFTVVNDFDYPGHSRRRMHGLPSRAGRELIDRLRATVEEQGITVVTERRVETLFAEENGTIRGVEAVRPDGGRERIGCTRLILACNGYGGNKDMVREYMPTIGDALYFGHPGNRGDAVLWGAALGAGTRHLGAFQGHGNVAHPHGILITWAVMMEGGIQVNLEGRRFWDESQGYSVAARAVLSQPEGISWAIFDARIAGIARQFVDFQDAETQKAVIFADTLAELAARTRLPAAALAETIEHLGRGDDPFGRHFDADKRLSPPYAAVRVTGALFHTQGGLDIDASARVKRASGGVFPNLFAVGGAACGVSGGGDAGYLSGNGLLSAVVLGRAAGRANPSSRHA
ncbi:MAG: FAD-dependent oxidoreductase [Rhodobacteraceae bacterium]|nr:FAD-dependent oxidoreductase [Paracoccaceae bacterium]